MIFSEVHHTFYFTVFQAFYFVHLHCLPALSLLWEELSIWSLQSACRQHHALPWGHLQVVLSRLSQAQGYLISHCLEDNIYLFSLRTFVRLHIWTIVISYGNIEHSDRSPHSLRWSCSCSMTAWLQAESNTLVTSQSSTGPVRLLMLSTQSFIWSPSGAWSTYIFRYLDI